MTDEHMNLLRDFRADLPAADHETAERVFARATTVSDDSRTPRRIRPLALLATTLALSAALALAITAPWQGGPSILAKASAAISAPAGAQVLYEQMTFRSPTIVNYRNPLLRLTPMGRAGNGSFKLWLELSGSERSFRSITHIVLPARKGGIPAPTAPWGYGTTRLKAGPHTLEVGGLLGPKHVIEADVYQPAGNRIVRYTHAPTAIRSTSFEPVALIQQALGDKQALLAGPTRLNGQKVERIDLTIHDVDYGNGSATYYIDARTFRPVEVVFHHAIGVGYPDLPLFQSGVTTNVVFHFVAYRYLPATSANLALTNIHTQHPDAKVICGAEFGGRDC